MIKIYYDGICKLCSGFIGYVQRYSKKGTFIFVPLQNATIKNLDNFSNTVIVETENGEFYGYWEAVSIVLKNMSLPFKFIHILSSIFPKKLKIYLYNTIAKNRYAWFGKHDSCKLIQ